PPSPTSSARWAIRSARARRITRRRTAPWRSRARPRPTHVARGRVRERPTGTGAAAFPRETPAAARGPGGPPRAPAPVEAPRSPFGGRRAEIDEMRAARAEAELAREAALRAARAGTRRLGG